MQKSQLFLMTISSMLLLGTLQSYEGYKNYKNHI